MQHDAARPAHPHVNALVAYALFQDWGNDPLRYRQGPFRDCSTTRATTAGQTFPDPGDTTPAVGRATRASRRCSASTSPTPRRRRRVAEVALLDRRPAPPRDRARHAHPPELPLALPAARAALGQGARGPAARPERARRCRPGMEVLVVISQTPVAHARGGVRGDRPADGRHGRVQGPRRSGATSPAWSPTARCGRATRAALEAVLKRLAAYKRVVVLSGEVHWGSTAQLTYWTRGPRRLDLARALAPTSTTRSSRPRCDRRSPAAGITLSDKRVRRGPPEPGVARDRPAARAAAVPRPPGARRPARLRGERARAAWRSSPRAG